MPNNQATRRAILGAITLAPIAGLIVARPAPAAQVDRSAWTRAFRAYEQAKAAVEADDVLYDRAAEAYNAAKPSMDQIDFRELSVFNGISGTKSNIAYDMDVEAEWERFLATENKIWFSTPMDRPQLLAKRRAALDGVLEYRRQVEQARQATGWNEATERNERLGAAACDAEWKLMEMPAPDSSALLWKLEKLLEVENGSTAPWSEGAIAQTLADARRLLGGEA